MTERIYYNDSYLRRFNAQVVARAPGGSTVYLDRTAFYPTSGGQPFDLGSIAGVAVQDVVDEGDSVAHVLAAPVDPKPDDCPNPPAAKARSASSRSMASTAAPAEARMSAPPAKSAPSSSANWRRSARACVSSFYAAPAPWPAPAPITSLSTRSRNWSRLRSTTHRP